MRMWADARGSSLAVPEVHLWVCYIEESVGSVYSVVWDIDCPKVSGYEY